MGKIMKEGVQYGVGGAELENTIVYGEIPGSTTKTHNFDHLCILFLFRKQTNSGAIYAIDTWNYVSLLGGSEPSDVSVTVSNHVVTITNNKSTAVQYCAILR